VNSHTGPQHMALLIEAGQMTASDYVPTHPDLLLASEGASTDAVCGLPVQRQVSLEADISILQGHSSQREPGGLLASDIHR